MWVSIALVLGGVVGGIVVARLFLGRDPNIADLMPVDDQLNRNYNELISEVSFLIRESVEKARLAREMQDAETLHKAILPAAEADYNPVSVSGRCLSAGSCGGDWWYHRRIGDDIIVWIGDVAGHGMASALVASACRAIVDTALTNTPLITVAEALQLMDAVLAFMTKNELHVTCVCLRLNVLTGKGEIASASHTDVYCLGPREAELLDLPKNPPLGVNEGGHFYTRQLQLKDGECLFLMTDGLAETPMVKGQALSDRRLKLYLHQLFYKQKHAGAVVRELESIVKAVEQGKRKDDVTFVAIEKKAA